MIKGIKLSMLCYLIGLMMHEVLAGLTVVNQCIVFREPGSRSIVMLVCTQAHSTMHALYAHIKRDHG